MGVKVRIRIRRGLRHLFVIAALVATTATVLGATPAAHGTDQPYSCPECAVLNGENNYITEVGGTNYAYDYVDVVMWKFNGGSSWNIEAQAVTEKGNHIKVCIGKREIYGHGETLSGGLYVHLSGREANYGDCRIP
jgi:hypothetical protein